MSIEKATTKDIGHLAILFDAYRQFYECDADLEAAKHYLNQRLSNSESTIFIAFNDESHSIGFVQLYESFCSVDLCKRIILYDLYVDKNYRQHGVGESLMNKATDFAHQVGAKRLDLETAKDNHTAQRLYEKLGYQRDNEFFTYNLEIE